MGCGQGSSPALTISGSECGASTSCGGDIHGTWRLAANCAVAATCPGAVYDYSQLSALIEFDADGTMRESLGGVERVSLPRSCVFGDAGVPYCTLFQQSGSALGLDCQSTSDGCSCSLDVSKLLGSMPFSGRFTTSGSMLSISVSAGGAASQYSYCVQGDTLRYTLAGQSGAVVYVRSSGTIPKPADGGVPPDMTFVPDDGGLVCDPPCPRGQHCTATGCVK
jgi:hypothetical protein